MGTGYSGAYADTIEWDELEKICPTQCKKLSSLLKKHNVMMDSLLATICEMEYDEDRINDFVSYHNITDGVGEDMLLAVRELQIEFSKTGLVIHCGYHDSQDDGDRYDDLDGGFFRVEGMYQLTKAGEKFEEVITRCFYVQYG